MFALRPMLYPPLGRAISSGLFKRTAPEVVMKIQSEIKGKKQEIKPLSL